MQDGGGGGATMQKQQKENQFVSPTSHDSHNHNGDQTALQRQTLSGEVDQLLPVRPPLIENGATSSLCEIKEVNTWISLNYKDLEKVWLGITGQEEAITHLLL